MKWQHTNRGSNGIFLNKNIHYPIKMINVKLSPIISHIITMRIKHYVNLQPVNPVCEFQNTVPSCGFPLWVLRRMITEKSNYSTQQSSCFATFFPNGEQPEHRKLSLEFKQPTAGCIAIYRKYWCHTQCGGITTYLTLWSLWGMLLMCQNTTMWVYGARIKTYYVLC